MATKVLIEKRIAFRTAALEKRYDAYTALVQGGVKSYMIDDRQLESELDALTAQAEGGGARKAFAILPRDW